MEAYFTIIPAVISSNITIAKQKAIIYALIISLLSTALLPSMVSASDDPTKLLLCTSQGYQWIDVVDDSASSEDNNTQANHCIYCFLAGDSDDLLSAQHSTFYLANSRNRRHTLAPSDLLSLPLRLLAQPRAPPIFT